MQRAAKYDEASVHVTFDVNGRIVRPPAREELRHERAEALRVAALAGIDVDALADTRCKGEEEDESHWKRKSRRAADRPRKPKEEQEESVRELKRASGKHTGVKFYDRVDVKNRGRRAQQQQQTAEGPRDGARGGRRQGEGRTKHAKGRGLSEEHHSESEEAPVPAQPLGRGDGAVTAHRPVPAGVKVPAQRAGLLQERSASEQSEESSSEVELHSDERSDTDTEEIPDAASVAASAAAGELHHHSFFEEGSVVRVMFSASVSHSIARVFALFCCVVQCGGKTCSPSRASASLMSASRLSSTD